MKRSRRKENNTTTPREREREKGEKRKRECVFAHAFVAIETITPEWACTVITDVASPPSAAAEAWSLVTDGCHTLLRFSVKNCFFFISKSLLFRKVVMRLNETNEKIGHYKF